jgi:hypothetical protein
MPKPRSNKRDENETYHHQIKDHPLPRCVGEGRGEGKQNTIDLATRKDGDPWRCA